MSDARPGLGPRRLAALVRDAVARCDLGLHGSTVLTEAATGAYVVTPVLAAAAGAGKVFAVVKASGYGTPEQVRQQTLDLARVAGVERAIEFVSGKSSGVVSQADIITNTGHVRPIDAETVGWMKPTAAIPLMYEAWEFRPEDVDLPACRARGIPVAGTNERNPAVDVFSYLGIMAVKLLLDAGVAVYSDRILLLCDNPFRDYIERGLTCAGAAVDVAVSLDSVQQSRAYDAILVALKPGTALSDHEAQRTAASWPGAVIGQFWGDIDRDAFERAGIPICPSEAPASGHMGILPSHVGPEPVVRLQSGGLKVGEILMRARLAGLDAEAAVRRAVESGYGQSLMNAEAEL